MTTRFASSTVIATSALILIACKPDLGPSIIEAQKANTEAKCACVKDPDYEACVARADAEHPKPTMEDGFKLKYSDQSIEEHHQQIVLAHECAKAADLGAPPK